MTANQEGFSHQPLPPSPRSHPFGLRAIIVLLVVQSIGYFLIVGLIVFAQPLLIGDAAADLDFLDQQPLMMAVYSILAPLSLLAAVGLWRLKRWAWLLTMVLLAYSMTQDIVSFWTGQTGQILYFLMALNVIKVGYLNQREVQRLFGELSTPDKL